MKDLEKFLRAAQYSFFKEGWCEINSEFLGINNKTNRALLNINQKEYENNEKNLGALSLPQRRIKKYKVFNDILKNHQIINCIENITGRKLGITCFMQMLTIGKTKSLDWHRDSYCRKQKFIGPIPPVVKIMICNNPVKKTDGPFQVVSGSHTLDFNNKFFDKLLPLLKFKRIKSFTNDQRKCIIFDGRLLHRRLFSSKNAKRSVTIISFESPKNYISIKNNS